MNEVIVRKPSAVSPHSSYTGEPTQEESPVYVANVGNLSPGSLVKVGIKEHTQERDPTEAVSV